MNSAWQAFGVALLSAGLAGCAAPIPGVATPVPVKGGPGPDCGPQAYPFQALHNFVRGQVIVRGQVAPDGHVEKAFVEWAADDPYLTAAALEGVRYCRVPSSPPGSVVRLLFVYAFYGQEEYLPRGVVSVRFAPPL